MVSLVFSFFYEDHFCFCIYYKDFFSFSLSCSSSTELCTSNETTCTSSYDDIDNVIPFVGHYNITVRAKSSSWEATSDHYEFAPLKICKSDKVNVVKMYFCTFHLIIYDNHIPAVQITQPELNVKTVSDSLLVEWNILSRDSKSQYHCQVRYHKVCPSLFFYCGF